MMTRSAQLTPTSLDLDARRCDAVISTGVAVRRFGVFPDASGFGPWAERLDLAGADLSRLVGAPVLLDHRAEDTAARIGVVESARLERGAIVASLRFSERAEVQELLRDLAAGIGGAISIGYEVEEWNLG